MERRNRGLSLLNQTAAHCISPSSCDQFTSLNVINLQLHASSTVSNPYTFNITKDISFNATCTSESTNITVTVSNYNFSMPGNVRMNHYGYSDKAFTINNRPVSFGKCSPSIYKGATITSVMLFFREKDNRIDSSIPPSFSITFSQHVSINKIIINNTIFDTTNITHYDRDSICSYGYKINANDANAWLINYFHDNYGKQITITLE